MIAYFLCQIVAQTVAVDDDTKALPPTNQHALYSLGYNVNVTKERLYASYQKNIGRGSS